MRGLRGRTSIRMLHYTAAFNNDNNHYCRKNPCPKSRAWGGGCGVSCSQETRDKEGPRMVRAAYFAFSLFFGHIRALTWSSMPPPFVESAVLRADRLVLPPRRGVFIERVRLGRKSCRPSRGCRDVVAVQNCAMKASARTKIRILLFAFRRRRGEENLHDCVCHSTGDIP